MKSLKLFFILFFILIGGILYLPFVSQFGYYNDDWYSMYAARVAGPDIFREMYAMDRPGRAYVMEPLYILFHGQPIYYNFLAVILRIGGAFSLLWLLRLLWPRQNLQNAIVSILFLVYPGFLNMPNGVDFQSHLAGLLLAFVSLGLMLLAFRKSGYRKWILYFTGVLVGLMYLSQMEYYIGFEFVRICIVFLVGSRLGLSLRERILKFTRLWLPYSIIPGIYLFWRIILFDSQRKATDLGLQLGQLLTEPVLTIYNWSVNFVQSFLNVFILAWAVPLAQTGFSLAVPDVLRAILFGLFMVILGIIGFWYLSRVSDTASVSSPDWFHEATRLGVSWLLAGLVVVIIANRTVTFPEYSRYGMVSAPGAILLMVVLIAQIPQRKFQVGFLSFLLFSAGMTHYANGANYAAHWADLRSFWWQVSWRIPHMEQGTTIVAHYPRGGIKESSSVWGPANQIYYPIRLNPGKVQTGVHAALLNHDTVLRTLNDERQIYRKEKIVETFRNYRKLLLVIQPGQQSCVQVIDGNAPDYSANAPDTALLLGAYSRADNILIDQPFQFPPGFLFGSEPAHDWCYYYQKASLARQQGHWDEIVEIYQLTLLENFSPHDPIEWMPFLQAFAQTGHLRYLEELSADIVKVPFVSRQVCTRLKTLPNLTPEVENSIDQTYCLVK